MTFPQIHYFWFDLTLYIKGVFLIHVSRNVECVSLKNVSDSSFIICLILPLILSLCIILALLFCQKVIFRIVELSPTTYISCLWQKSERISRSAQEFSTNVKTYLRNPLIQRKIMRTLTFMLVAVRLFTFIVNKQLLTNGLGLIDCEI